MDKKANRNSYAWAFNPRMRYEKDVYAPRVVSVSFTKPTTG